MLNDRLCRLHLDRFVTAVLTVLDPATHSVSVANAGHMPPIFRTGKGEIQEPGEDEAGLPLGIMDDMQYPATTVQLGRGDSLTLYTDGLNEAVSEANEFYTIDRVRLLVKATGGTPSSLGPAIIDDVCKFIGEGRKATICAWSPTAGCRYSYSYFKRMPRSRSACQHWRSQKWHPRPVAACWSPGCPARARRCGSGLGCRGFAAGWGRAQATRSCRLRSWWARCGCRARPRRCDTR